MEDQYYRKSKPKIRFGFTKLIRRKSFVISLLILIPVFSFMFFSKRGILERISLEMEKKEKLNELQIEQKRHEDLQKELKALETDPKAIEKAARERYKLKRQGETLYLVNREKNK